MDGVCYCRPGWRGTACEQRACPDECSGRGACVAGECRCDDGFEGANCGAVACAAGCTGHGRCWEGTCLCAEGYAGADCSVRRCANGCSGHGACHGGVCVCFPGWGGPDCGAALCPSGCNGHGACVAGACVCAAGYVGADCGLHAARRCATHANCSGSSHGVCLEGECFCAQGWSGADCSIRLPGGGGSEGRAPPPQPAASASLLQLGEAYAKPDQAAGVEEMPPLVRKKSAVKLLSSSQPLQPQYLSALAQPAATRDACSASACNLHGYCHKELWGAAVCVCYPGWKGASCDEVDAKAGCVHLSRCNNHGTCDASGDACECYAGWSGADCSASDALAAGCAANCSGHGECVPQQPGAGEAVER